MVDLPAPERPVKNTVKPCRDRDGLDRRSSLSTAGKVNQCGSSRPSRSRRRCSVPEMFTASAVAGI